MAEVLQALRELPMALTKLGKPKGLIDHRGLGKPSILGEDAENKFRLWSVKLEDYAHGVFGGKSREVLEWASAMDTEITETDIMDTNGIQADDIDPGRTSTTSTPSCTVSSEQPLNQWPSTLSRTWQRDKDWKHGEPSIVALTRRLALASASCSRR